MKTFWTITYQITNQLLPAMMNLRQAAVRGMGKSKPQAVSIYQGWTDKNRWE